MRIAIITLLILLIVPVALCNASDDDLCALISQIKIMPFKNEPVEDSAYIKIVSAGYDVLPCLIANVVNMAHMPDPRKAPVYPDTTVGDIAFFVFLDITNQDLKNFLPAQIVQKYNEQGVYVYFEYAEKIENRIELQTKLIRWLTKKR